MWYEAVTGNIALFSHVRTNTYILHNNKQCYAHVPIEKPKFKGNLLFEAMFTHVRVSRSARIWQHPAYVTCGTTMKWFQEAGCLENAGPLSLSLLKHVLQEAKNILLFNGSFTGYSLCYNCVLQYARISRRTCTHQVKYPFCANSMAVA